MSLDTHLYRRGATYYWRRALPACPRFSKTGSVDLRISLRTHVLALARQRARRLSVALDAVLNLLSDVMQAGLIDTNKLRALLNPILAGELERAEVARALSGERGPDEIARRAEAELAAARSIENEIRHNRLDLARDVLARSVAAGLPIPKPGTDEHTVLARLVLRGLPAVHRTNADREQNPFDDDIADFLPSSIVREAPDALATQRTLTAGKPAAQHTSDAAFAPVSETTVPLQQRYPSPIALQLPAVPMGVDVELNATYERQTTQKPDQSVPAALSSVDVHSQTVRAGDWTVTEAMTAWLHYRHRINGTTKADSLCIEEQRNYRVAGELFASLVGDYRIVAITEDDLITFKQELNRLPSMFGRGPYRNMTGSAAISEADKHSAAQLVAVAAKVAAGEIDRHNIEHVKRAAEVPRLAKKTVNKHLDKIKGLLNWLAKTKKVPIDRDLLELKLRYNKKEIGRAAKDDREAFSNAEIRDLFAGPAWTGCAGVNHRHRPGKKVIKDAKFWIPLLIAHHGLRLGETAQLLTADVIAVSLDEEDFADWDIDVNSETWTRLRPYSLPSRDGIATLTVWCIQVTPEEETRKNVKTPESKRLMPIHPLLLELGFLEYHANQKRAGKLDLFSGLKPVRANRTGAKLGEWFSKYLEKVEMKRSGLSLYSARHSFNTHLINRDMPVVLVSQLMGHTQQGQTGGRYFKGAALAKLVEKISSVNYRIHLSSVDGVLSLTSKPLLPIHH
jgi:hypothetical protein